MNLSDGSTSADLGVVPPAKRAISVSLPESESTLKALRPAMPATYAKRDALAGGRFEELSGGGVVVLPPVVGVAVLPTVAGGVAVLPLVAGGVAVSPPVVVPGVAVLPLVVDGMTVLPPVAGGVAVLPREN